MKKKTTIPRFGRPGVGKETSAMEVVEQEHSKPQTTAAAAAADAGREEDEKPQEPTWHVRCHYCRGTQGRCVTTASGRSITECTSCGRVVEERQSQFHQLFHFRAHDSPLSLVTTDLSVDPICATTNPSDDDDPFHSTGFITAFSTWSLEPSPLFAKSSFSFAGHLAELERVVGMAGGGGTLTADLNGPLVSVDQLRAYLQILDVSSILDLDQDIADHAFQLFRDCSSMTCLRNRSVEALATAALVQAIREAQEPRTLQEISAAANLPQKEIGKYIKILGEALKLSQPINSNSISVHMPRFCTLLQLNKSAQELAAHIGEVVISKCFCTRRNPISISAAAIYLACQLEDKRKTQAEICKVTGLTEVTLRKVYKELLENWDDLLPPNYTPAVPPEKAFPMTTIPSGRSSMCKVEPTESSTLKAQQDKDRQQEAIKQTLWQTQVRSRGHAMPHDAKKEKGDQFVISKEAKIKYSEQELKGDNSRLQRTSQPSGSRSSGGYSNMWQFNSRSVGPHASHTHQGQTRDASATQGTGHHRKNNQITR